MTFRHRQPHFLVLLILADPIFSKRFIFMGSIIFVRLLKVSGTRENEPIASERFGSMKELTTSERRCV